MIKQRKTLKSISAFFPAYNDEGTIKLMVNRLQKVLKKFTDDYEIIVVDDFSPDKSGKIADEIAKRDKKVKVIHHEKNKGYGGALKSGFKAAKKQWVFYTDGDAQYNVNELEKLVPFTNEYDVINGYKNFHRAEGVHRKIIANVYNLFMKVMFGLKQIKEVDCDFRLMKKEIFDKIDLKADDGTICLEMIKKIEDAGFKIKNVPVNHYERIYGTSQFFRPRRVIQTLLTLIKQWKDLVLFKR